MDDAKILDWVERRLRKLNLKDGVYTMRFWDSKGGMSRVTGKSLRDCVEKAIAGTEIQPDYDVND